MKKLFLLLLMFFLQFMLLPLQNGKIFFSVAMAEEPSATRDNSDKPEDEVYNEKPSPDISTPASKDLLNSETEELDREKRMKLLYNKIIHEPYEAYQTEIIKGRKETYENVGNVFFTGGLGLLAIHFSLGLEGTLLLGEAFSASGFSLCILAFLKKRELKKQMALQNQNLKSKQSL